MDALQTDDKAGEIHHDVLRGCIHCIDDPCAVLCRLQAPFCGSPHVVAVVLQADAGRLFKGCDSAKKRTPAVGADRKFRSDEIGLGMQEADK